MQENSMGGAMLSEGNKPRLYCYFALEREPKPALLTVRLGGLQLNDSRTFLIVEGEVIPIPPTNFYYQIQGSVKKS